MDRAPRRGRIDVDDRHRYATMARRPDESADLDPRIESEAA